MRRKTKYNNRKVVFEYAGKFYNANSVREADVKRNLLLRQSAGEISNLEFEKPFEFPLRYCKTKKGRQGKRITYIADAVYNEGRCVCVVDAKGFKTREYQIKKAMMVHFHGIEVIEK